MKRIYFFVACTIFFVHCTTHRSVVHKGEHPLTKKWTPDTRVILRYEGGTANMDERIEITGDSISYEIDERKGTTRHVFYLSKEELNQVARVFYDNDFTRIDMKSPADPLEGMSFAELTICHHNQCWNKKENVWEAITADNAKRFNRVLDHIRKLADQKAGTAKNK